jgi:transposase InsO family protein
MWACDFMQTYDLFFRSIFVFFIIELGSRRVAHFGVTRSPSDLWIAQQWRRATPFGEAPRFLIRDNDRKCGVHFARVTEDVDILRTPVRAPKANAVCERFIGSIRRECLDHVIILSERHLRWLVREYVDYFNHARPHQGIDRIPDPPAAGCNDTLQSDQYVIAVPVLGGLHHDYRRAV